MTLYKQELFSASYTAITSSENTDVTIDVSSIFENGTQVVNAYDGTITTVADGKVTFNAYEE